MSDSRSRYLVIISKIIFFYSLFYVVMKILAIFQGAWLKANLVLTIPFIVIAAIGGWLLKKNRYYWWYVILGAIIISAIRYYEKEWMVGLHQYFS